MARPPAPKPSRARLLRQVLAGVTALASLMAIFFLLLLWRTNTPEEHLNFGATQKARPEQNHE
jgi:hypothetical protein